MLAKFNKKIGYQSFCNFFISFNRNLKTSSNISYTILEDENNQNDVPVLLAHGALGNKKNFNTIAKRLSVELQRPIITYDARNHGNSKHSSDMSLKAMGDDVEELLQEVNKEKCVFVGHSLGGRTSMYVALHKPHLIEDLVIVDMPLNLVPGPRSSLMVFLEAMKQVKLNDATSLGKARLLADRQLKPYVRDEVIRQFILTNLEKSEDGNIGWKCNVDALISHFNDPDTNIVTSEAVVPYQNRCLFLCGSNSNYVTVNEYSAIKSVFPQASITHVPDCGHWVHFEKPNEFLQIVKDYLTPQK